MILTSGSVQGDSTQQHVKSLDVVLGAEMAVLIVDDTAGVWPQHSRNLLQVSASNSIAASRSPQAPEAHGSHRSPSCPPSAGGLELDRLVPAISL